MSPCVCSVIDHRWGQNVVKTIMKWHTSRKRVCHWCFYHTDFDVLCDLLLSRPTATWNLFVLYNDQKRKKTDTRTCLVPLECSRICTSLGIFWVPKRYFSSLPLLFFFILGSGQKVWGGGGPEHLEVWLIKNTWPTPKARLQIAWPTP